MNGKSVIDAAKFLNSQPFPSLRVYWDDEFNCWSGYVSTGQIHTYQEMLAVEVFTYQPEDILSLANNLGWLSNLPGVE